jgi:hypothetical protein
MTALSPALDLAFAGDRVIVFGALTLTVGSDTLRLLDGSDEIEIDGHVYSGEDETYGSWAALDKFTDGTGDSAPSIVVSMIPRDDDAIAALTGPDMQGEIVSVIVGAVSESTGLLIGDPYKLFDGEVDIARYIFGKKTSEVEYECVGGMDRMFFDDEGIRLVPSFHAQVWPGELGLNHVTGIKNTIYWGGNAP